MPQNNCDPVLEPVDTAVGDLVCPKCGVEMEPIETGPDGPPMEHLQLCPGCYLVIWRDQDGVHTQQGVPMEKGHSSRGVAGRLAGEPEEC
jgi:predicted RNA-binding Zn-ribbon protein involved in translation (DUF1610 family)